MVAKALHKFGPRKNQNYVPINCAAIPEELLESELFGYEKGAFTGAAQNKKGRLYHANGGTLFLDEIGDMRPSLQAKLLRVLQEKEFEPIGGLKPVKVDVRVIAATNKNLEIEVEKGKFREDLYYRLSVIPLRIPPLRERAEDIPILIDKFIQLYNRGKKAKLKGFSPEALEKLKTYHWPGNVRELKNLVQRLSVLHTNEIVRASDLPEKYLSQTSRENTLDQDSQYLSSKETNQNVKIENIKDLNLEDLKIEDRTDFNTQISEFEDRLILQALMATNGNKKQAAKRLNLKRTTLLEKIKKKKLDLVFKTISNNQL